MSVSRERADPVLEEYSRLAPHYDSRWSFYIRSSVEHTMARLPLRPGDRLLDVGCGTAQLLGAVRDRMPSVELVGVDPSAEMLSVARSRLARTRRLVAGRAESLPFPDGTFDWVVSTSVFHYLRQPQRALAEFQRLLKPSGGLVITDWCDDYLACKLCDALLRVFSRAHFHTYTRSQCERLLRESSFESIVIDRYRISWIWGLMTACARRPAQPKIPLEGGSSTESPSAGGNHGT